MRITRLSIENLRRHRSTELELAPGLTVVRGPNEAGKTTLQRALELALTRRATSSAAELDGLVPWDGRLDDRPTVALEFTYDDEEGNPHQGRLVKRFLGAKGTVHLEIEGETTNDPARADELLAELSGVPTEGFFASTASVRHHELAGLQRDEAALRDRLQASISGADRGTSRAKRQLERALQGLRSQGAKYPGRLKVAEDAVADVTASLRKGEDALGRLERDRDALSVARERRRETERALTERRSLLEKARQAERLHAERNAARERYERYRTAVTVRDELTELEASHPSPMPLAALRPAVEHLRTLGTRIATLQEALAGEVTVQFELPPESGWRRLVRSGAVFLVAGIVVAAAGLLLGGGGTLSIAGLALGAILGIVGIAFLLVGARMRGSDRIQQHLRDAEVDRRLRGRSDMEQDLKLAQASLVEELEALGLPTSEAAEERLAAETAHVAEIDGRRARLGGLVGDEPRERLPERRDAAALEIEQKTSALDALGPIAKEPRARERLEVEVADAERQLERARDDEADARARVEQNPVDAEDVAGLAERLQGWNEQLAALRRRDRVYAATLREIVAAEQATMQRATRYLERRMVRDVARVTDGRYRRVRVDDTNLGIDVFAPEKGGWVPVTDLSQGTLDVVYLAARLGLVRLVTGDRRPPLVLDDPFVTLDDGRAPRALELLREVATDFQVIYLTTSDRYDEHADRVVVLDGPTAADAGDPAEAGEAAPA